MGPSCLITLQVPEEVGAQASHWLLLAPEALPQNSISFFHQLSFADIVDIGGAMQRLLPWTILLTTCLCMVVAVQPSGNELEAPSEEDIELELRKCDDPTANPPNEAKLRYSFLTNPYQAPLEPRRNMLVIKIIKQSAQVSSTLLYLTSFVSSLNGLAASTLLTSVGTVTSLAGPIGYGIGFLVYVIILAANVPMGGEMITNAIQDSLDEISWRFGMIEDKMDHLELTIEKTIIYSSYKTNQDSIRDVMLKYHALARSPNYIALQEFQEVCEQRDPYFALAWIHRHLIYEDIGAELLKTILKDVRYDREKLRMWIQLILKDVFEAAFLREACLGAKYGQLVSTGGGIAAKSEANVGLSNFELLCAVKFGRQEADAMIREIARKLDETETALMEDFPRVSLTQDIKQLILEHPAEGPVCDIVDTIKKFLQHKYFWMNWWVALAKKELSIHSLDGHYAQVIARLKKKNYYLVVIFSEVDTLLPLGASATDSWNFHNAPNFWETRQNSFIEDMNGMFDNIVHVTSSIKDYECDFTLPEFAISPQKDPKNSKSSKPEGNFIVYFKSRDLGNTLGCRASSNELALRGVTRLNHCSGKGLRRVVKSVLDYYSTRHSLDLPNGKIELASTTQALLSHKYGEFTWTVMIGQPGPVTLLNCEESANCANTVWKSSIKGQPDTPLLAIWTKTCDFTKQIESAKKLCSWTKSVENELFKGRDNTMDAMTQYFRGPYEYVRNKNIATEFEEFERNGGLTAMKEFERASKVVLLAEEKGAGWTVNEQMKEHHSAECSIGLQSAQGRKEIIVRFSFYADHEKGNSC